MTEALQIAIGALIVGYGLAAWWNAPQQRLRRNRRILRRSLLRPRE